MQIFSLIYSFVKHLYNKKFNHHHHKQTREQFSEWGRFSQVKPNGNANNVKREQNEW